MLYCFHVVETHCTLVTNLYAVCSRRSACSTTHVEGTHSQLCTWFTNRLSCHDTNRLTRVHLMTTRQVTAVTFRTYTESRRTVYNRTYFNFVDTLAFDKRRQFLVN